MLSGRFLAHAIAALNYGLTTRSQGLSPGWQILTLPERRPIVTPTMFTDSQTFFITHVSNSIGDVSASSIDQGSPDLVRSISCLRDWVSSPNIMGRVPLAMLDADASPLNLCTPTYKCWFSTLHGADPASSVSWEADTVSEIFSSCMLSEYGDQGLSIPSMNCSFELFDRRHGAPLLTNLCDAKTWSLNQETWIDAKTDDNLKIFIDGGVDSDGLSHPGWNRTIPLVEYFYKYFTEQQMFRCSITDCSPVMNLACDSNGRHLTSYSETSNFFRSRWAYFVLESVANIYQHLSRQYFALDQVGFNATLEIFSLPDFWDKDAEQHTTLRNVLTSLSLIFVGVSIFLPPLSSVAPLYAGTAGAMVAGANTFYERSLSGTLNDQTLDRAQKAYAQILQVIWTNFLNQLTTLFNVTTSGDNSTLGFSVDQMISNGAWSFDPALIRSDEEDTKNLQIEVRSRTIDQFWNIPHRDKMWVMFLDLGDIPPDTAKCQEYQSGPPQLKYCADGGVYYTYNFREPKDLEGHVCFPWGFDSIPRLGIDPQVIFSEFEC